MKANTLEGPLYAMIEEQFVRVDINITALGRQDELIKSVAAALPTNMPNIFSLTTPAGGTQIVHAQSRNGTASVWTELASLNLRTVYTIHEDGSRSPLFINKPRTSPPEHETTLVWSPALANLRLFFISSFTSPPPTSRPMWTWKASYLIARAPGSNLNRRPPLPNLFSDARICMGTMGNEYVCSMSVLAEAFAHGLNNLQESQWNSDAAGGVGPDTGKTLFSFDKNDKQIPPTATWWDLPVCIPVNNINYGELTFP